MVVLLVYWAVCFIALAIMLPLLSWIYSVCGGNLGLTSWRRETIIALVATLLQAVLLWLVFLVTGVVVVRVLPVAGIVLFLCYKITHPSDSLFDGAYAMENSAIAVVVVTQLAIVFVVALFLSTLV